MKSEKKKPVMTEFAQQVERAMKRAAKLARKVAKMHGTPIYVERNGKVIALKP